MPRFFHPEPLVAQTCVTLDTAAARHAQVLRLQPGDEIRLFNGQGGEWAAQIEHMGRKEVTVNIIVHQAIEREAHNHVVLAVGMEPEITGVKLPDDIILDSSNFIEGSKDGGMFSAGAAASPLDVNRSVQSATAASLHAIQVIRKTASTEAA